MRVVCEKISHFEFIVLVNIVWYVNYYSGSHDCKSHVIDFISRKFKISKYRARKILEKLVKNGWLVEKFDSPSSLRKLYGSKDVYIKRIKPGKLWFKLLEAIDKKSKTTFKDILQNLD